MPKARPTRLLCLACPLLGFFLGACAWVSPTLNRDQDQPAPPLSTARPVGVEQIRGVDRLVAARPGRPTLLLLDLPPDARPPLRVPVDADGTMLTGEAWYLGAAPRMTAPGDAGPRVGPLLRWLGEPRDWTATPADGLIPAAPGVWVLRVDLGVGGNAGERPRRVRLGDQTLPIAWLDVVGSGSDVPPPAPVIQDDEARRWVAASAAIQGASPLTWWRAQLLRRRAGISIAPDPGFGDEMIDLLAAQEWDRWATALARLASTEPELGVRTEHALTVHIDLGNDAFLPAWPDRELDRLSASLLDPMVTDERLARSASLWLAALPEAGAWVRSDAGPLGALAHTFWLDGVNLSPDELVLAARGVAPGAAPELVAVEPGRIASIAMSSPLGEDAGSSALVGARRAWEGVAGVVSAGDWRATRRGVGETVPVLPPGTTIGPLHRGFDLSTWRRHATYADAPAFPLDPGVRAPMPSPVATEWATGALLMRGAPAAPGSVGEGVGGGWVLYLECRHDAGARLGASAFDGEACQVWLGPFGAPRARIDVRRSGAATLTRFGRSVDQTRPARDVTVVRDDERWAAWIALDPALIGDDLLVELGLIRTDARGVRTSWPRPLLPVRDEPGRVRFDLSSWTDPTN